MFRILAAGLSCLTPKEQIDKEAKHWRHMRKSKIKLRPLPCISEKLIVGVGCGLYLVESKWVEEDPHALLYLRRVHKTGIAISLTV